MSCNVPSASVGGHIEYTENFKANHYTKCEKKTRGGTIPRLKMVGQVILGGSGEVPAAVLVNMSQHKYYLSA
jgi:hypothetical protein